MGRAKVWLRNPVGRARNCLWNPGSGKVYRVKSPPLPVEGVSNQKIEPRIKCFLYTESGTSYRGTFYLFMYFCVSGTLPLRACNYFKGRNWAKKGEKTLSRAENVAQVRKILHDIFFPRQFLPLKYYNWHNSKLRQHYIKFNVVQVVAYGTMVSNRCPVRDHFERGLVENGRALSTTKHGFLIHP